MKTKYDIYKVAKHYDYACKTLLDLHNYFLSTFLKQISDFFGQIRHFNPVIRRIVGMQYNQKHARNLQSVFRLQNALVNPQLEAVVPEIQVG